MSHAKEPKLGDKVMVRQLGQTAIREGVVTALHGDGHITCEIAGPAGKEIESVGFGAGHKLDASWDWPA